MTEEGKNCPYCGEIIKAKALKCKFCGEWLKKEEFEEPRIVNCPYCGEEILSDTKQCEYCGETINIKLFEKQECASEINADVNIENKICNKKQRNILLLSVIVSFIISFIAFIESIVAIVH